MVQGNQRQKAKEKQEEKMITRKNNDLQALAGKFKIVAKTKAHKTLFLFRNNVEGEEPL